MTSNFCKQCGAALEGGKCVCCGDFRQVKISAIRECPICGSDIVLYTDGETSKWKCPFNHEFVNLGRTQIGRRIR